MHATCLAHDGAHVVAAVPFAVAAAMGLASPCILFYCVSPRDHMWESVDQVPPYVSDAIPWFLILMVVELIVSFFQDHHERRYNLKESICSVALGIFSQVAGIPAGIFGNWLYLTTFHHLRLWTVPHDTALCWLALFLGVDLCYYALHRFCHESHFAWWGHSVHHSGEVYNVATALRQGVVQGLCSPLFYVPLAVLGLPPAMFLTHKAFNLLYQFYIHTECLGSLGPLEYVLNTPSHHRVHHRPGGECNYAGVLIIWDRLFGTFKEEGSVQVDRYGWGKGVGTFDPLSVNLEHARRAYRVFGPTFVLRRRLAFRWRCSLTYLFKPMRSDRAGLWRAPVPPPAEDAQVRGGPRYLGSAPPPELRRGKIEAAYLSCHLLLTLVLYVLFEGRLKRHGGKEPLVWAMALWVMASLVSLGRLSDGDASGKALEWLRLAALVPGLPLLMGGDVLRGGGGALVLLAVWAAAGRAWWIEPAASKQKMAGEPKAPREEESVAAKPRRDGTRAAKRE